MTLAGLALGAALIGGVAWATIPAENGLFTACKLKATGTIRLIDPSGPSSSLLSRCTSYETQISWNQKGQKGDPGVAGANGAKGIDGTNGAAGPKGAAGPNGVDGTNGVDGKDGAAGPKGADGRNGTNGLDGTNGLAGEDGAAGANGADGTNGRNGADGAPGVQGPAGPQGPAGSGGSGLPSLDALRGMACNAAGAPATVFVTYGPPPGNVVTLACKPLVTLTVTKTGPGSGTVTSNVPGISCGSSCSHAFVAATVVTLTATSAGDFFAGWSGACSGFGPCTVTMNAAASVTANFALVAEEALTVTKTGSGAGTVTSNIAGISCGSTCSHDYPAGTAVTLTATSANDIFTGWSGACSGTGPCTLTMNAPANVTANFVLGADLDITQSGGSSGTFCLPTCQTLRTESTISSVPAGLACLHFFGLAPSRDVHVQVPDRNVHHPDEHPHPRDLGRRVHRSHRRDVRARARRGRDSDGDVRRELTAGAENLGLPPARVAPGEAKVGGVFSRGASSTTRRPREATRPPRRDMR